MPNFIMTDDFPKNQAEFDKRFNNEQACYNYLLSLRWPQGFVCQRCGNDRHWQSATALFICTRCEHQHSVTAGTIMHGTRKPLLLWFKAMWWFTTRKSGVNAINLQDLLGFGSYNTAWLWLQKLRSCTVCKGREKLTGTVEAEMGAFVRHSIFSTKILEFQTRSQIGLRRFPRYRSRWPNRGAVG